jgi:hypothetical protein
MKFFRILCGLLASYVIAVSASAAIIYENGSLNGTYVAPSISPPQTVSNSFLISSAAQVTSVTLGIWTLQQTLPATLSYSFGRSAFATDLVSGSTVLNNVFAFNNGRFDVYLSSFAVDLTVGAGEYWLTLGNGRNNANGEIFWDTNFDGLSRAQYRNDADSDLLENSQYFLLTGVPATDPGPGPNPQPVPEPGSLILLAVGVIGVAASRRHRNADT